MKKSRKGNVIPSEVWVTLHNIGTDDPRPYLCSVSDKPWDKRYDAPITKFAENVRYVLPETSPKHLLRGQRRAALKGMAVSRKMIEAAQASYSSDPEYGLSDKHMAKAIKAALAAAVEECK